MTFLPVISASAQNARSKNVELCNGADRTSPETQISGCSALIASGGEPARILAVAHNNRGNALVGSGEYDRAIEDFSEALRINSGYAKALNNRGVAFAKKGMPDRAIQDFDEAVRINPDYANAFANRAEAYQSKGEYDLAIQDFDGAIRLRPTPGAWNARCRIHVIKGDLETALSDCNEALKLDSNSATTFDLRGIAYLRLGEWGLAIANFSSALSIDPALARSLYGRGIAYIAEGSADMGETDIAKATSMEPTISDQFSRFDLK